MLLCHLQITAVSEVEFKFCQEEQTSVNVSHQHVNGAF